MPVLEESIAITRPLGDAWFWPMGSTEPAFLQRLAGG